MNSIDLRLLALLQDAETPLYSAYRWVDKQFEDKLSLTAFLEMVDALLDEDVVRLWHVDFDTYERSRLTTVPTRLDADYQEVSELDDTYDPFGFSLTTGEAAPGRTQPDWEFDIDFNRSRFVISAISPSAIDDAIRRMGRLFAPTAFVELERRSEGSRVRIEGNVLDADDEPPDHGPEVA